MFRNKIIFLFILISSFSFAEEVTIKALKAYLGNDESAFPIITCDEKGDSNLTIEFDVDYPHEPSLNIVFKFCDRNWTPYGNLFLRNSGKNVAYYLNLEPLPITVKDANYHYKGTFPDEEGDITFPFSGKYMFFITDSHDTSIVYASGIFVVIRNTIPIDVTVAHETIQDKIYFPTDLARVFKIKVDFNLPEPFFPAYIQDVEIIENHKVDFPYVIDRNDNTDLRYFNWNADRKFTFTTREIRPGNEYRQTDLRNINLFGSEDVYAQLDGVETSRFFKQGYRDLNGGSILTRYKDDYANYLNVKFRLRPPEDLKKRIFLVGSFTDWLIYPEYELLNDEGLYSLTTRIKRGKYDYQYVTADLDNSGISNIDWYVLEGNNWTTSNNYYVFVYYAEQDKGGYDRIIGYQRIITK